MSFLKAVRERSLMIVISFVDRSLFNIDDVGQKLGRFSEYQYERDVCLKGVTRARKSHHSE